ncbi:MAG: DUF4446 family protein [Candidatus Paceibacterota bacterium]|jgi:hypothetical protein
MTFSPELYVAIGIGFVIIILIGWIIYLQIKLARFMAVRNAKTIEDTVMFLRKEIGALKEFQVDSEKYLSLVEKRLRKSITGIDTVRFNPFKGTGAGGNQSFATAFTNEDGNGVIVSSLYSRDHVSIFSKPVNDKKSIFDLTAEESEALKKALEKSVTK